MKKGKNLLAVFLAAIIGIMSCCLPSAAQAVSLKLSIETEQTSCAVDGTASINVILENTGDSNLENVVISNTVSEGFEFTDFHCIDFNVGTINAGEKYVLPVMIRVSSTDTDSAINTDTTTDTAIDTTIDSAIDTTTDTAIDTEKSTDSSTDSPIVTPLLSGDVDMDGKVGMTDVTMIQRGIAGLEKLTDKQSAAALVDGQKTVNMACVTYIQRMIAGLVPAKTARRATVRSAGTLSATQAFKFGELNCIFTTNVTVSPQSDPAVVRINSFKSNIGSITTGTKENVRFTAEISGASSDTIPVVLNSEGTAVCKLYDDGENCDDVAGDGVWSGEALIDAKTDSNVEYTAVIGSVKSDSIIIYQFTPLKNEDIDVFKQYSKEINAIKATVSTDDDDAKEQLYNQFFEYFSKEVQKSDDRKISTYEITENGFMAELVNGMKTTEAFIEEYPENESQPATEEQKAEEQKAEEQKAEEQKAEETVAHQANNTAPRGIGESIGGGKIICLEPWNSSEIPSGVLGGTDFLNACRKIKNANMGFTFDEETDRRLYKDVDVETFANLEDYKIIYMYVHGNMVWTYPLRFDSFSIFDTSIYEIDDYETNIPLSQLLYFKSDLTRVDIRPAFFTYYYGPTASKHLNNCVFYLGSCGQMDPNYNLGTTLIDCGASLVFGYTLTASVSIVTSMAGSSATGLIKTDENYRSYSFKDAMNHAMALSTSKDVYPFDDGRGYRDYAQFRYLTAEDASKVRLFDSGSSANIDFSYGSTYGWNVQGDVRIVNSLLTLTPMTGITMAMLGTGLGSVEDSNTSLTGSFIKGPGSSALSMRYDFVSEEPMEWLQTDYNDKYELYLEYNLNGTTKQISLGEGDVDSSEWQLLGGNCFNGGDDTSYHTGWQYVYKDLSNLPDGTEVLIKAHVWDEGDSIYDSALLLDNISLS